MKKLLITLLIIASGLTTYEMFFALLDTCEKPEMFPFYKYLFCASIALVAFAVSFFILFKNLKRPRY